MELVLLAALVMLSSCSTTSHGTQPSALGTARDVHALEASLSMPGVVQLETVNSADWQIDRSGLLNLNHPAAKAAGLTDGLEPIVVFFHVLRHPKFGTFIVDTGMESALRDAPEKSALSGLVRSAMRMDLLKMNVPLGEWLEHEHLNGVFLTHLHLDHVAGLPDVPSTTPLYAGPGETSVTGWMNVFTRSSIDAALAGKQPISEWPYEKHDESVVDIFGDGSVWALWVPGHTPGSTAYLVRTTTGAVLLTGDGSHTRWGWEHHVEPGTFTNDAARSRVSFERLQAFSKAHPDIEVRLGHQR